MSKVDSLLDTWFIACDEEWNKKFKVADRDSPGYCARAGICQVNVLVVGWVVDQWCSS